MSRRWPHRSLSLWLCPRPAAGTPGPPGPVGAEPAVRGEEGSRGSVQPAGDFAVPASREPRGAPAAGPVRPPQPPDPRPPGRGAGAAGKGPVRLQLELLRPALRQAADCAPREAGRGRLAWLSAGCRWRGRELQTWPREPGLRGWWADRAVGRGLEFPSGSNKGKTADTPSDLWLIPASSADEIVFLLSALGSFADWEIAFRVIKHR